MVEVDWDIMNASVCILSNVMYTLIPRVCLDVSSCVIYEGDDSDSSSKYAPSECHGSFISLQSHLRISGIVRCDKA